MAASLATAEEPASWGSYYAPGNIIPGISLSVLQGSAITFGVQPSAEVILLKPGVAGFNFIDIGAEASGYLGIGTDGMNIGAIGSGTLHLGFRGFEFPGSEYLDRADLYAKFGLGLDFISPNGTELVFASSSGVNYFLNDRLMAGVGYFYRNGVNGLQVNLRYRIGATPAVSGMGEIWAAGAAGLRSAAQMGLVSRFYAYFFFAFYTGGYHWAPDTFNIGNGTVWRYSSDGDVFFIEKVLIETAANGNQWWRLRYYDSEEEVVYEFSITPNQQFGVLRYKDENGIVTEYNFDQSGDRSNQRIAANTDEVSPEELSRMAQNYSREDITVPAGTFRQCYQIRDEADGNEYTWWFAPNNVPGRMVKYQMIDSEDSVVAELQQILSGQQGRYLLGTPTVK